MLTNSNGPGWPAQTLDRAELLGGEVWPQIAIHPIVQQVTLEDPGPLASAPAFAEIFAADRDRRAEIYSDPDWQKRALADIESVRSDTATLWDRITIDETTVHAELRGLTLAEVARARDMHPFDLMVELSLAEGLQTRFGMVLTNYDDTEIAGLLRDPRTLVALSDAGAHVSQLCDAAFSTRLLSLWVRDRETVPLEFAIWRLTGQPAQVFRIEGRGVIRPGAWADLVSFEPETVAPTDLQRVCDLPGGADRLINRSVGISDVWVNGVATCRQGEYIEEAAPGRLLRNGIG
jgi:N-acyl-D-aspartate/D-glutamate deacylase